MCAIMAAGIGAMAEAARQIRQQQRKLRHFLADRRAAQRAGRLAMYRGESGFEGEERTSFDCFYLCGNCKLLADDNDEPCPACNARAWIDLGDHASADELRDLEEDARRRVPFSVKIVAMFVTLMPALLLAALLTSVSGLSNTLSFVLGILGLVVALGVMFVIQKPMAAFLRRWQSDPPSRWRMPLPEPNAPEPRVVSGSPELAPGHQALEAPFSGRPCLAWEVAVLFDAPGDAMPPEWVLHEVKGVSFTVDGESVDGDDVRPKTALEPLSPAELAEAEKNDSNGKDVAGPDLKRFLRKRGLFQYEGEFELYEAIVPDGVPVQVTVHGETAPVEVETISGRGSGLS